MNIGTKVRRAMRAEMEFAALFAHIKNWESDQRALDVRSFGAPVGRHNSQIAAIVGTVENAACNFRQRFDLIPIDKPTGEYCTRVAQLDEAVVWLRRFFAFFADKFDQRRTDLHLMLIGADEILWSCYQAFAAHRRREQRIPPPVPFVAFDTAPAAVVHQTSVPASLKVPVGLTMNENLRASVDRFPVPLLQIPPFFARAPWSLILLGHEAGHFITHDLGLDGALDTIGDEIADDLPKTRADPRLWMKELAADTAWLLLMGEAAVYALRDELWGSVEAMASFARTHPSPALRLHVLKRVAVAEGIIDEKAADDALAELPDTGDGALIDRLVDILRSSLGHCGKLRDLAQLDVAKLRKNVDWWRERLRQDYSPAARDAKAARYIAAAAYLEWVRLSDAGAMDATATLGKRMLRCLPLVAPEGDRAPQASLLAAGGDQFATMILASLAERTDQSIG